MINKFWIYSLVIGFGFIILSTGRSAAAQDRDIDEQRWEIGRTGIEDIQQKNAPPEAPKQVDKEEKYTAGKDKKWFTVDDSIYHYFLVEHDSAGKIFKRSCYKTGKDRIPYTKDDVLQDYLVYEYGPAGRVSKEISYNGKDNLQYTAEYTYDYTGRKIKVTRYDTHHKEIHSMTFIYDQAGRVIQDVEYNLKDIEKYHRFEYDNTGKMTRAMEYHVEHAGKGPDGLWFTPDDIVSSTKQFFYNPDGTKSKELKYISPGPDGKWFTEDDVLQYYVIFEYQK